MLITKVVKMGGETVAIIPEEAIAKLGAKKGDDLCLIETPAGLLLTNQPGLQEQVDAAEHVMRKHRAVLRELAK